jgi:hypothetical protein
MAYKKKNPGAAKELANQLHTQLLDHVADLVTSDSWSQLLTTMTVKDGTELSRFSFNNIMLILMQKPDASAVVTFGAWKERGRQVLKGQTSLRISVPLTVKDREDPEGRRKVIGFQMRPEFDVSQTEPIWQDPHGMIITPAVRRTSIVKPLQGDAPEAMWGDLTAQLHDVGYTVETGNTGRGMGYTKPSTKTVVISSRASKAQACKTLAHELGHILADHVDDLEAYSEHRGQMETVAESFAFMVCAYYGLDSASYSAPYIGTWAGQDPEEILSMVQKTGTQVLSLYRAYVAAAETPAAEKTGQVAV